MSKNLHKRHLNKGDNTMQVLMEVYGDDFPLRRLGGLVVLLLIALSTPAPAFAHGGQIEVGGGVRGPVQMDAAQQNAIALKLVTASPHPLSTLLNLNGEVQ